MAYLVLASNSPRRRQLLALGGWMFAIAPVDVDEQPLPGEDVLDYVLRLAQSKARAAAAALAVDISDLPQPNGNMLVVAADTTVVDDGLILGKPRHAADARRMLRRLRGHIHQVYTALAVLRLRDGALLTDLCATDVPMRNYSDSEMEAYIESRDPLDKAGAYAIQHPGFHPVEHLQGCYANVVGLPLCHLARTLHKMDTYPHTDLPHACQQVLEYSCPVFQSIYLPLVTP
jgi:MAF protein